MAVTYATEVGLYELVDCGIDEGTHCWAVSLTDVNGRYIGDVGTAESYGDGPTWCATRTLFGEDHFNPPSIMIYDEDPRMLLERYSKAYEEVIPEPTKEHH